MRLMSRGIPPALCDSASMARGLEQGEFAAGQTQAVGEVGIDL